MTAQTPYPLPRQLRESAVLVGDGTAGPYGPSTYRIFDVADVAVYARAEGEESYSDVTDGCAIEKTAGAAFDTFSVTFGAAVHATTHWYSQARRRHERQSAVTQGGAISGIELEKELSKQATVLSETRRDIDRALRVEAEFDGSLVLPVLGDAQTLKWDATARRFLPGPSVAEIEASEGHAEDAAAARAGAEAALADTLQVRADTIAAGEAATQAQEAAEAAQEAAEAAAANPADGAVTETKIGSGAVTEIKLAAALTLALTATAASRTALKALPTNRYSAATLAESGREGQFVWNGADVSAGLLGAGKASSAVDSSTETITSAGHLLRTGNAVIVTAAVNGLSTNTLYWVIRVDDSNFKLASSYANAIAGAAFNLTGTSAVTVRQHLDPLEGVYVCPPADISGASGAWVRRFDGPINARWFGAGGGTALLDRGGIQAAIDYFSRGFWGGSGAACNDRRVHIPAGIYLIDPALPIELCDYLHLTGEGWSSTMLKASTTSAGTLVGRAYNGTSSGNPRVNHVKLMHMRAIVTGASQIAFDLRHIGRLEVGWVLVTTQDRADEYSNAKQRYWPGSAAFTLGVGDSGPHGYINGTDIVELHHFKVNFLEYGVRTAPSANQKAPEKLHVWEFEISDTRRPMEFNPSAGMGGHIHDGTIQRWGTDTVDASTGVAPSSGPRGIDSTANRYKFEDLYFECNDTTAGILIRSGSNNCVVDTASMNRYGTTTTILSDSGTSTYNRST